MERKREALTTKRYRKRTTRSPVLPIALATLVLLTVGYHAGARFFGGPKFREIQVGSTQMRVPIPEGAEERSVQGKRNAFMAAKLAFTRADGNGDHLVVYMISELTPATMKEIDARGFEGFATELKRALQSLPKDELRGMLNSQVDAEIGYADVDITSEDNALALEFKGEGTRKGINVRFKFVQIFSSLNGQLHLVGVGTIAQTVFPEDALSEAHNWRRAIAAANTVQ